MKGKGGKRGSIKDFYDHLEEKKGGKNKDKKRGHHLRNRREVRRKRRNWRLHFSRARSKGKGEGSVLV